MGHIKAAAIKNESSNGYHNLSFKQVLNTLQMSTKYISGFLMKVL